MPSPVPTPVAAALGIVPAVLEGVLRLPGKAVQLPVYAVSHALTTLGTVRREYDALAERGERLIAKLRGTSFDEVEDVVEDALQGTPFAKPYDVVEDALEDAGEAVTAFVRTGATRARKAAGTTTRRVGSGLDKAADSVEEAAARAAEAGEAVARSAGETAERTAATGEQVVEGAVGGAAKAVKSTGKAAAKATKKTAEKATQATGKAAEGVAGTVAAAADEVEAPTSQTAQVAETPAAEAPKGEPTPAAPDTATTPVDTAASPETVEVVERVSATVGGEVLDHDELPLPDYDHLTLGSLRGRMRSLDLPQLVQIRDYEKAHADRLPIVTMLDNRIAKLATDPTAPLSGGGADGGSQPSKAKGGSKVSPSTADAGADNPTVAFGGLGGAGKPS